MRNLFPFFKKRKESLAKETTQMHKPKVFIVMLALGSEYTRRSYDLVLGINAEKIVQKWIFHTTHSREE